MVLGSALGLTAYFVIGFHTAALVSATAVAIWLSIAGVGAGALYLLVVLVRDWRRGTLW